MNWGALVAVILWGASFVATKMALAELAPVHVMALRVGLGAVALNLWLTRQRRWGELAQLERRDWLRIGLVVLVSVFLHLSTQVMGLQRTTAVNGSLLITLAPLFMFALSAIFFGEAVTWLKGLGFLTAILGSALVITRGHLGALSLSSQTLTGDLLIVTSAVGWALYSTLAKELMQSRSPLIVVTLTFNLSLPVLAVLVALTGPGFLRAVSHASGRAWGAVLFLGWGCSALAYVLWYAALKKQILSQVSVLQYWQPLVTTLLGVFLLNESIVWTTVMGGGMILGGVAMVNRQPQTKPGRP